MLVSRHALSAGHIAAGQLAACLRALIDFERYHLHRPERFQNLHSDPLFDKAYFPQNCKPFRLPAFLVERKHLLIYGEQTSQDNRLGYSSSQDPSAPIVFPIHPLALPFYAQFLSSVGARESQYEGIHLWGIPTSSTRTLLAWQDGKPEGAFFAKLTLPFNLLGDRRLYLRHIARGVGLNTLLRAASNGLPQSFRYFEEPIGFVPRGFEGGGVLIRAVPQSIQNGEETCAPILALTGGTHGRRPLFLTLLDQTGLQASELIRDVICDRYAKLWLGLAMYCGIMLEGHAQNLMLSLSPDLNCINGFIYRDLDGLRIDWEMRRKCRLPLPHNLPAAHQWIQNYAREDDYPYTMCVFHKFRMSLNLFTNLLLDRLESVVRMWSHLGTISGLNLDKHDLTRIFSQRLLFHIHEMFGVKVKLPGKLIFFTEDELLISLLKIRRQIIDEKLHLERDHDKKLA